MWHGPRLNVNKETLVSPGISRAGQNNLECADVRPADQSLTQISLLIAFLTVFKIRILHSKCHKADNIF
jgi:hypothetical protein